MEPVRPLGAQADAIRAAALSFQRHRNTNVVGEMGTEKSFIVASAAYLAGCRRVFILAPPHLVKKWRREILQTVPGAWVAIVRTIRDLVRSRSLGGSIQFVICSREQAKLGYRWVPAAIARPARNGTGGLVREPARSRGCSAAQPALRRPPMTRTSRSAGPTCGPRSAAAGPAGNRSGRPIGRGHAASRSRITFTGGCRGTSIS